MDTHFLAPLFTPRSVVVFAGPPDDRQLAIAPSRLSEFIARLRNAFDAAQAAGESSPVLLASQTRTVDEGVTAMLWLQALPEGTVEWRQLYFGLFAAGLTHRGQLQAFARAFSKEPKLQQHDEEYRNALKG